MSKPISNIFIYIFLLASISIGEESNIVAVKYANPNLFRIRSRKSLNVPQISSVEINYQFQKSRGTLDNVLSPSQLFVPPIADWRYVREIENLKNIPEEKQVKIKSFFANNLGVRDACCFQESPHFGVCVKLNNPSLCTKRG